MFEAKSLSNDNLKLQVTAILECMAKAQRRLAVTNLSGYVIVDRTTCWVPLPPDWVKIDIDEAFKQQLGIGCGGVFRDAAGVFVRGFKFHAPGSSSLTEEIYADVLALKM